MPPNIFSPRNYHFIEILATQPDENGLELPPVLIAPHRQVFSAFDSAGTPTADATVGTYRFSEGSRGAWAQEGEGDGEFIQYDLPGVSPGAVIEQVSLYAEYGAGASRSVKRLQGPQDQTVVVANAGATATLTPAATLDGTTFTLTDPAVNFVRLLGRLTGVVYPTTDAQRSAGAWLMVRLDGIKGGPFVVTAAPSATTPNRLSLQALGYVPLYTATAVSYELLRLPAEYSFVNGPLAARQQIGGATNRFAAYDHLRLTLPGTVEITRGGGQFAVLELTGVAGNTAGLHGCTITLTDTTATPVVFYIDVDAGGGAPGGAVSVAVTNGMTAAQVAAAIAGAVDGDGTFATILDPQVAARVRIIQKVAGTTGNTVAERTGAVNFFSAAAEDPGNPGDTLFAIFSGGAAGGASYHLKNFSPLPVRITFSAPTGADTGPSITAPTWSVAGGEMRITVKTFDSIYTSVYDLNYIIHQSTNGINPGAIVEPASLDNWTAATNVTGRPSVSKSQAFNDDATPQNDTWVAGEPAGQILIPAATTRAFPLVHRLLGSFRTAHTFAPTLASRDRGSLTAANNSDGTFDVELPVDQSGTFISRPVDAETTKVWEGLLTALNAELLEYYQEDLGYEHAPEEILYLGVHPDDLTFLQDPNTDWYPLPVMTGVDPGVDTSLDSFMPAWCYNNGGSIDERAVFTATPLLLTYVAEIEYREPGEAGNDLLFTLLFPPNGGAEVLAAVAENDEMAVTLGVSAAGILTGTTLQALAQLLDTLDDDDTYVYPVKIASVRNASTGAAVAAGDDYAGWSAFQVDPFSLREVLEYTTTDGESRTCRLYTSGSQELEFGADGPVVRISHTLRGKGSVGELTLYAGYSGLRTDTSAIATLAVHGRVADLVRVREQDVETILGSVRTAANPLGLAVDEYFKTGRHNTCYILGIDEVSEADPWGTEEALDRAMALCLRRNGYRHFVFNDAHWIDAWATAFCENLGGTVDPPARLVKPMELYIPTKIPAIGPDLSLGDGSELELIEEAGGNTTVVTNLDMIEAGVEAGDILLSLNFPEAGSFALQDGSLGFKVVSTDSASPTRVTLRGTGLPVGIFSEPGSPKPFSVYRPGSPLTVNGVFDEAAAQAAMVAYHSLPAHNAVRLRKHVANSYEDLVNGIYTELDGVYFLAQYAGIVASRQAHLPTSATRYGSTVRNFVGASSFFSDEGIAALTGVGLTCPIQLDGPTSAVTVYRDVTSYVSPDPDDNNSATTRVRRRRGATVVDDMLILRLNRRIGPKLGPNLLTDIFLDMVSADVDSILEFFRSGQLYKKIQVVSLEILDDDLRAAYGVNDTGIVFRLSRIHQEEAAAVVFHHIIRVT